ncbi:hypothetical protein L915_21416, partial [Phytophthora nicotianae]
MGKPSKIIAEILTLIFGPADAIASTDKSNIERCMQVLKLLNNGKPPEDIAGFVSLLYGTNSFVE